MPSSAMRRSMVFSAGRSAVLADSPASTNSSARFHTRSAT
jgi:hypothetical protein